MANLRAQADCQSHSPLALPRTRGEGSLMFGASESGSVADQRVRGPAREPAAAIAAELIGAQVQRLRLGE